MKRKFISNLIKTQKSSIKNFSSFSKIQTEPFNPEKYGLSSDFILTNFSDLKG